MITAGIDVSAKELVLVIKSCTALHKPVTYENSAEGHQALINVLKKKKVERVCIEATGVYHLDLAVALYAYQAIELMVLNPKAAKQYGDAVMNRSKTDGVDAALLAEYAHFMPFQPWQRPDMEYLHLRAAARRLAALNKQRTQTKNYLHALEVTQSTPAFVLEDVHLSIAQIDTQIDTLRTKALELIAEHALMAETLKLLVSVKGIAEASAIQIMGELLVLPAEMTAKQWVAMAGLDPRHHQSGNSVHKRTRISKVGNRYLRHALYMPALSATRHDLHVRGYYLHLIEGRGLKKMQAICAVMRKLLHAIHAMLQKRQSFDSSRFYTLPEEVA